MSRLPDRNFWRGKRVLLTGHTGFKGAWCAHWLSMMGADVTGYALSPGEPSLYALSGVEHIVRSELNDLSDRDVVAACVRKARPDLVLHMAAQALVQRAIVDPLETWQSNVIGTANLLATLTEYAPEAVTLCVTSDKVYRNANTGQAFREADEQGGKDPYSASKAACELVVASWRQSYAIAPLATVRGGNVIGGGDFAADRIVPDVVRATLADEAVSLRSPDATRPWQHVLDCLSGYLLFLEYLSGGGDEWVLNIGPETVSEITVADIATQLSAALGGKPWVLAPDAEVRAKLEARTLAIDASRARALLGWNDRLDNAAALSLTCDWYAAWREGADMAEVTRAQIDAYVELST